VEIEEVEIGEEIGKEIGEEIGEVEIGKWE
jgi:hypothetical protein